MFSLIAAYGLVNALVVLNDKQPAPFWWVVLLGFHIVLNGGLYLLVSWLIDKIKDDKA